METNTLNTQKHTSYKLNSKGADLVHMYVCMCEAHSKTHWRMVDNVVCTHTHTCSGKHTYESFNSQLFIYPI